MGGPGSGMGIRWNTHRTKGFVQEFKAISSRIFDFKNMQELPGHGIEISLCGVKLLVKPNHIAIPESERGLCIPFDKTKMNYGNVRYWLECPMPTCERRCGKLYLCKLPDPAFFCRKCLKLSYRSQNKTRLDRMIDKKWAIIRKIEPKDDCIYTKPKWTHWRTFYRLKGQAEELDRAIILGGYAKFSVLPGFASNPLSDYFDLSAL